MPPAREEHRIGRELSAGEPCGPEHAWLALVVPATASRFAFDDPALATALPSASDEEPEVEVLRNAAAAGRASTAVVRIDAPAVDTRRRGARVLRRLAGSVQVRRRAQHTRRTLRGRGYESVDTLAWDPARDLRVPGGASPRDVARAFPHHLLVIGWRGKRRETVFEAARAAAEHGGGALGRPSVSMRACVLVALGGRQVLRLGSGPARRLIDRERSALEALRGSSHRIPTLLAAGDAGIARWCLESRLPGSRARAPLADDLRAQCVDFLAELHEAAGESPSASVALHDGVEGVQNIVGRERTEALHELASWIEGSLTDVPRGFGHGDFFHGNLLVESGRLSGVVDWDTAGPGRLPLVDLLHLEHMSTNCPDDLDWGRSLVERLLPWARAGADSLLTRYCRAVGLSLDTGRAETFVGAYWLDRVLQQLTTYADRARRPQWLAANLDDVLRTLLPLARDGDRR